MQQAAQLQKAIDTLKMPANERTQERIHQCGVLLTDHLRAFPANVPYNQLCDACRSLAYNQLAPRIRITDTDESGQGVLRVLLSGSVLVQRRFGVKAWLPTGFLRTGDILGLPAMLTPAGDDIRYTTLGDSISGGVEFAVLRSGVFERCLRSTYERAILDNVRLLQSTPSFSSLPEATLKQLVSCARLVTLGPGELLTREGEATDELLILKSGACPKEDLALVPSLLPFLPAAPCSSFVPAQVSSRLTFRPCLSVFVPSFSPRRLLGCWLPPRAPPRPLRRCRAPRQSPEHKGDCPMADD